MEPVSPVMPGSTEIEIVIGEGILNTAFAPRLPSTWPSCP
jgi:hypothetical protein